MDDSADMALDAFRGGAADNADRRHLEQTPLTSDHGIQGLGSSSDLEVVDKLKFFLAIAPSTFSAPTIEQNAPCLQTTKKTDIDEDQDRFRRFLLPNGEYISCIYWNGLYHITGTDIIRTLVFRLRAFGRRITNMKKFEEGVFSDLRNLKAGVDATLEVPKSTFLDLLFKNNCIRTQKKQKVFYWYSVSHDKLFLDALERDARREKLGQDPSSKAIAEPALSFRYDPSLPLLDQLKADTGTNKIEKIAVGSDTTDYQAKSLLLQHYHHHEPQLHIKLERSEYPNIFTGTDECPACTSSYNPFGPYLPRTSMPQSHDAHAESTTTKTFADNATQLCSKPLPTTSLPHVTTQQHTFYAGFPASSSLSLSQSTGAVNGNTFSPGPEKYSAMTSDPNKIRFICPWYTCGQLFPCMSHLLQHIPLHMLPVCTPTMLEAADATSAAAAQQASLASNNEEVTVLLNALNSSAVSPHTQYSSGYMSTDRSPASAYSPHAASQEATEEVPHQPFMIAPAPSIRRRSG